MRTVCVFSGSSVGTRPEYAETARALGRELARRGLRLVYGGASVGLMGEVADAVLGSGGEAVGVIPQHLMEREIGHTGLTELHVRGSMHDRKALMAELSDGFVALPGGFGTLEEFAEVVTWCQLGLHSKPCALLDVAGFYQPLLMFLDHAATEGFIGAESRQLVLAGSDPVALLDALESWVPRRVDKWSSRVVPVAPGPAG